MADETTVPTPDESLEVAPEDVFELLDWANAQEEKVLTLREQLEQAEAEAERRTSLAEAHPQWAKVAKLMEIQAAKSGKATTGGKRGRAKVEGEPYVLVDASTGKPRVDSFTNKPIRAKMVTTRTTPDTLALKRVITTELAVASAWVDTREGSPKVAFDYSNAENSNKPSDSYKWLAKWEAPADDSDDSDD